MTDLRLVLLFPVGAILAIATLFVIASRRQRGAGAPGTRPPIDSGEWLLRGLGLVALTVLVLTAVLFLYLLFATPA
jgi:hypothetical protein